MADTIANHGLLRGFTYVASGTNAQGNHWCARDYGNGANAYHYSNTCVFALIGTGITVYAKRLWNSVTGATTKYVNPDGSRYFNNGHGAWIFTSPTSQVTTSTSPP